MCNHTVRTCRLKRIEGERERERFAVYGDGVCFLRPLIALIGPLKSRSQRDRRMGNARFRAVQWEMTPMNRRWYKSMRIISEVFVSTLIARCFQPDEIPNATRLMRDRACVFISDDERRRAITRERKGGGSVCITNVYKILTFYVIFLRDTPCAINDWSFTRENMNIA